MSTRSPFWKDEWARRKAKRLALIKDGKVTITFVPSAKGRIHVSSPFQGEFITGARELLGRWKAATGVWTFDFRSKRHVIELCERVYGKEAIVLVGFPAE